MNYMPTLEFLEISLFPERFIKEEILVFGDEHERTKKALVSMTCEYQILGERIGKKGQEIYKVRIKNKTKIIAKRISND